MEETSMSSEASGKPEIRVLLVEDDEITTTLVRHRLEREGIEVVHLMRGTDALDLIRGQAAPDFDLVLLDVKLPGASGFEVLEELRRNRSWKDAPVVMLTAMGREEDVLRGFALGANEYIPKPFSPAELMARIQRLLR